MSDSSQPEAKHYRLAIRRPVTMAMLFLSLLVFGWRSYQQLPINLMPDISYPTLTVRTEYEGAAPEDVEKLVTRPLEEMLSIVSGMVEISSVSSPGLSEIILEFTWDTEMNTAQQDVRDRLDLFDPPNEVTEKPVILRYDPTLDPVMRVAISVGPEADGIAAGSEAEQQALTGIRDASERYLKSDLEAEKGIAQVLVKGGREEEIQILVEADRLKSLGLSLQDVINSLAQQNINLSGGRLREGRSEYLVRTLNEFKNIGEIGESIIVNPSGIQVKLSDVAQVFMGTKERESIVRLQGREAVAIDIYKEGDANTVQVCDTAKRLLDLEYTPTFVERVTQLVSEQMRAAQEKKAGEGESAPAALPIAKRRTLLDRLPDYASLSLISDQSRFIVGAINEVRNATILGGVLALMVLFLFLHDFRSTLIIGVAIPISLIAAFLPMFMRGITLNTMSLGGLALGVGMLVDNSIVVLESIFRCREEGDGTLDAAERGTQEVASAVVASTLTTVAVFFPIAFVEGIAGQLFGDLALTVTFSLLASLLTALYLIPLIVSRKGLALATDQEVVWLLRAYRELRAEKGSAMGAVLGVFPRGVVYALVGVRSAVGESFAPTTAVFRAFRARRGFTRGLAVLGTTLLIPLVALMLIVQLLLQSLAAVLVTLLFFVCLVILAIFWVLRGILRVVLWTPLLLFDWCFRAFRGSYAVALRQLLHFSPVILILTVLLAVHAGMIALELGRELIPPMKQGEFGIQMEARTGMRLEQTEELAQRIEEVVRRHPEVDSVTVEIGREGALSDEERGDNTAQFTVLLRDPKRTAALQDGIVEDLRATIQEISREEITFTLPALFSFKTAVELQVVGDDLTELRRIGQQALEAVRTVDGVEDAELSLKPGYPEVIILLDRELLANKGILPGQVAARLRTEVQGEIATRFNRGGEKVDIRVRTDRAFLNSVDDLRRLSVTDGNPPIPLMDVAKIEEHEGPSEIRRIDQRQVVLINANVEGRDLGAVSSDIQRAVSTIDKPADYEFVLGGQNRELQTSYTSLRFALLLAIFLVYVVMACQFESVWHPALVMFSVPLAFIGVIYALYFSGTDFSIMVFLGGIVLAGIVVNNAIVLVDYINHLRARGMPKREAIIEAAQVRLRPILMTTVTTVLGLIPMIMATGEGAELRRPMAITVMSGLSSATILTLFIIPMAYQLFGGRDKAAPAETL